MLWLLAYVSGISFAYLIQPLFNPWYLIGFLSLFLISFALRMRIWLLKDIRYQWTAQHSRQLRYSFAGFALLLGMLLWQIAYHTQTQTELTPSLARPITVSTDAVLEDLPVIKAYGTELVFKLNTGLSQLPSQDTPQNQLKQVRVLWPKAPANLWPGQHWQLVLRLRPLHGFQNPGSFDYVSWLRLQQIDATGSVLSAKLLAAEPLSLSLKITQLRAHLRALQQGILPNSSLAGVLTALSLGDKSQIPIEVSRIFINTGTAHLLAISGLHVGLVASLVFWLAQLLWRYLPRLCLYLPAKIAGLWLGVLAAWGYALLAGLSVSTQRAALMVSLIACCLAWRRRLSWFAIWLITLAVVLTLTPLAINQSGLWLSFLAVMGLAYLSLHQPGKWPKWQQWLWIQVMLGLLLAPLMLALFQQASLASIPANLLAIPWIGMVIVPLTLIATILLLFWPAAGQYVLLLALHLLNGFWPILAYLAALPHLTWHGGIAHLWMLILGLAAMLWLLAPRAFPLRSLSLGLLLPAWLNPAPVLPLGALRLTVLDVGQGLASVIQTRQHTLIYDTGPGDPQGFNAGMAVLVPFLRSEGVRKVNAAILSHGDNDHIAGLPALLAAYGSMTLLTSEPKRVREALALSPQDILQLCQSGGHWRWDDVDFIMRYPSASDLGQDNNSSCVLQLKAGGKSLLLTGDIEKNAEQSLVQRYGTQLQSTVMVVPHHGSAGSAWPQFIMTVAPQYAIFPSGYMNRFGFPRQRVLSLYHEAKIQTFNSAINGSVTVTVSPQGSMKIVTAMPE